MKREKSIFQTKQILLFMLVSIFPRLFNESRRLRAFLYFLGLSSSRKVQDNWWVQVGANDGGSWDPVTQVIKHFSLKALLIEPVPYLFERLSLSYEKYKDKCRLLKVAIGNKSGVVQISRIKTEKLIELPSWASQISSIRKDVLLRHDALLGDLNDSIEAESVNMMPLKKIFKDNFISSVDYLQIDTEGYDEEVLNSIDFSCITIKLISFEHKHFKIEENLRIERFLISNGFEIQSYQGDTFAWRSDEFYIKGLIKKFLFQ